MGLESELIAGKYSVLGLIGSGGMGNVYEAVHIGTDRPVAIKFLRSEYADDPMALARFDREARAAGRIGHDNICDVMDVGRTESGVPFLVMPLLRGRPLSDLMKQGGVLEIDRVLDIAVQTLSALDAAHAAGLVHRDLKPENIFLVRMGGREDFVKLLDFGISKALAASATDGRLTQTGTVVGTPFYMSPEQARGRADLDGRVDIYAVGVLLYEMLTGRAPFTGENYQAILSGILLNPVSPPRSLRPEIPVRLQDVILRAMSRKRDGRYGTAAEMRAALLDAVPTELRPDDAVPIDVRRGAAPGLPEAPTLQASPPSGTPSEPPSLPSLFSESVDAGISRPVGAVSPADTLGGTPGATANAPTGERGERAAERHAGRRLPLVLGVGAAGGALVLGIMWWRSPSAPAPVAPPPRVSPAVGPLEPAAAVSPATAGSTAPSTAESPVPDAGGAGPAAAPPVPPEPAGPAVAIAAPGDGTDAGDAEAEGPEPAGGSSRPPGRGDGGRSAGRRDARPAPDAGSGFVPGRGGARVLSTWEGEQ